MKKSSALLLSLLLMAAGLTGCHDKKEVTLSGGWQYMFDFTGEPRYDAVSFSAGTKGYLFGGCDFFNCFWDLWEYSAETGHWTALADFPGTPRTNVSFFFFEDLNKAYICLGTDGENYFNDLWEYDIATNVWSRKADFPGAARQGAIGFALNGKGYILGGVGTDSYFRDYFSYNPATDVWTSEDYYPGSRRSDGAAFVYNNMAYILGGINSSGYNSRDFWRFDPVDQTQPWQQLNYLEDATEFSFDDGYTDIARSDPAAFVLDDYGYIAMGHYVGNFSGLSTTWRYDFANDRWYRMQDFASGPRYAAACFTYPGRAVIIGGRDRNNLYKEIWAFWPNGVPELK